MRFLTCVTLVFVLFLPSVASAQRGNRGGGGGGGGGGGWSHGGGSWNGGGRWGGGGYWGGGFYGGYYPYASFGWGGYGSPGYSYYYDSPSTYGYESSSPRISSYYDPTSSAGTSMSSQKAQLIIEVPDPNAELFIQGQRMTISGNQRIFVSPDLEQGKSYTYSITLKRNISGRTEEDKREIDVRAGTSSKVDFSQPQKQTMPAPQAK
jgi:uncharacterized protein (TIGR03000 family)